MRLEETEAVDGVRMGPVSKEQPAEAQPVAAGPTKVGLKFPRLYGLTAPVRALVFVVVAVAAVAPCGATISATASDNRDRMDRSATLPRMDALLDRWAPVHSRQHSPPSGDRHGERLSPHRGPTLCVSAPWDRLGHHLAYGGSPLLLRQERLMPNLDFCCAMFALVVFTDHPSG